MNEAKFYTMNLSFNFHIFSPATKIRKKKKKKRSHTDTKTLPVIYSHRSAIQSAIGPESAVSIVRRPQRDREKDGPLPLPVAGSSHFFATQSCRRFR